MFVSTEMAGIRYYDYVVSVNNTPVASHVNLYEVRLLSPGHNIHKAEQIEVHVVYTTLSLSLSLAHSLVLSLFLESMASLIVAAGTLASAV